MITVTFIDQLFPSAFRRSGHNDLSLRPSPCGPDAATLSRLCAVVVLTLGLGSASQLSASSTRCSFGRSASRSQIVSSRCRRTCRGPGSSARPSRHQTSSIPPASSSRLPAPRRTDVENVGQGRRARVHRLGSRTGHDRSLLSFGETAVCRGWPGGHASRLPSRDSHHGKSATGCAQWSRSTSIRW